MSSESELLAKVSRKRQGSLSSQSARHRQPCNRQAQKCLRAAALTAHQVRVLDSIQFLPSLSIQHRCFLIHMLISASWLASAQYMHSAVRSVVINDQKPTFAERRSCYARLKGHARSVSTSHLSGLLITAYKTSFLVHCSIQAVQVSEIFQILWQPFGSSG